jgi:hypothetical protein
MGVLSIAHWIVISIIFVIYVAPVVKILQRAGFSGWWVIVGLIPVANIVGLWVFAFTEWPALAASSNS